MAITITAKKSLDKKRETILAFLRSDAICVFCFEKRGRIVKFNNQFENEHVISKTDDSKQVIACSACNQQKLSQDVLTFCYGNEETVNRIMARFDRRFTESEIEQGGKLISQLTSENSAETGHALTTSEIKWLCDKETRIDNLATGTVIHATNEIIEKISKVYNLSNCEVHYKK
jgi:hypothetical protein